MDDTKIAGPVYLKYYQEVPNAGDQFSRVVAERYFSTTIIACDQRPLAQPNLILVGSLLEWSDAMSYICGAGLITSFSKLPVAPKAVNCVRGPLTSYFLEKQGIRCDQVFADPGILAPRIFDNKRAPATKLGIVPHYVDSRSPWLARCRQNGVRVIDVLSPLAEFFDSLLDCETILSSSLHGIVFAHAYGKPALWIQLSDQVIGDGFKFYDYYLSMGVSPLKVTRVRVAPDTDPYEIAQLATFGQHSELLSSLAAAVYKTRRELEAVHP